MELSGELNERNSRRKLDVSLGYVFLAPVSCVIDLISILIGKH
jgi:hypothetical protein